ncbi:TPR-like protein [Suillus subalutaceus]|uniref:TPR-like protein n=1 Tax=Suillus subalutaceus TaxID=48586 RepID=UPI001B882BFA|nr:TPR-like protein [Suillus subalutaceus]KAG1834907.1 TPR-like protein [Suillus subalutaceus]
MYRALCPPSYRSLRLNNLALSLRNRFLQQGTMSDLDRAIVHHRAALELLPPCHYSRSMFLDNLALSLRDRFQQRGIMSDLDEAIELHRAALLLRPPGYSERSSSLNNLAASLQDRFQQRGIIFDLDEAIELHQAALLLRPPGHSDRSSSLNNLATSLQDRFQQGGNMSDLDDAIELHRAALLLRPLGHSDRSSSLNNLAASLRDRFLQRGIISDLDEAIELHRAALLLRLPGHSDRSLSLNNLALSLRDRSLQRGNMSDLGEAIELHRAALELLPPCHSNRFMFLNNLAASLHDIFQQQGIMSDLDEAIELHRAALKLIPPCHSNRSSSLNNLAACLQARFQRRGIMSDLDEAIELHRAALELLPPCHSNRSMFLNNLAASLHDRFQQQGIMSDLDEVIELHRASLLLRPPGHSERSSSLNNLAGTLYNRFEQRGIMSDLDEAIELHRAALLLYPPNHSDRSSSLSNLALSLHDRFLQRGIMSDLDEAIEVHRAALLLRPPGHSDRFISLNNLATSLQARFQQQGIMSDLDEVIELLRAALELLPPRHSDRYTILDNLASSLNDRFKQRGIMSDLDEAIELHRAVLELLPPCHFNRSMFLNNLVLSLRDRFRQRGVLSDRDEALSLCSQLPHQSHPASCTDLSVAKSWAASAHILNHDSALLAYKTALKFLDQRVALLSSSSYHLDVIREAVSSLATDAFSCSVRRDALTTAVELVEQGRAVFWTQLAHFNMPLDELSVSDDTGTALAGGFKRLSFLLRSTFDQSTEDQSPQTRKLTMQWDDVVSRIRMLRGFSRFLLPPLFSDLQKAAEDGPVIILNASHYGCDALIIHDTGDPIHIPLNITEAAVSELCSQFQSLAEQFGSSDYGGELISILRKLWAVIVDPVVRALRESKVIPGSRIWWCPTAEFTLLPLHAAGPYKKKRDNLSDIYISSYTPTLATLIRARQRVSRDAYPQHFVAIGRVNPDGGKELECCLEPVVSSFTSLEDSDATVQGALDALNHNQWLHLACHGTPNQTQPFESSFAMRDGPLMIKDIIRSDWQNPEFAFLSACHTTVGDENSPDESIHLAAAMQFAGFRSVIGSMWSVDDDVARLVVSAFYGHLVDSSGRLDSTRAAAALHMAMKSLPKNIPLEQQIVFFHVGV